MRQLITRNKNPFTLLFQLFLCCSVLITLTSCSVVKKLPFAWAGKVAPCPGLTVGILIGGEGDPLAEEQRDGYELALEQANADGGPAGCKLSLAYIPEEVSGSSNQVYQAVRSLVEDQQVIAILGGTSDTASMLAATLINRFSVPMLVPGSSGMATLPDKNYWTFRVNANDEMYSQTVFEKIKKELGEEKTISLIFEDTSAGHDAAVTAAGIAAEQGFLVIHYGALNSSQPGAAVLTDLLTEGSSDVLYLIVNHPNQALEILNTLNQYPGKLPLTILQGNGFINRAVLGQPDLYMGNQTGQMLAVTSWASQPDNEGAKKFEADFASFTAQKYGAARTATPQSAIAYNSLRILQMTIRSGSAAWNGARLADIAAAREALRTDLQAYREKTPAWGNITFNTGGQNQAYVYLQKLIDIPALSASARQKQP